MPDDQAGYQPPATQPTAPSKPPSGPPTDQPGHDQPGHDQPGHDQPLPTARRVRLLLAIILVAAVLGIVLVLGTLSRLHAGRALRQTATADAVPTVSVVHPRPSGAGTIALPARLQAWAEAPIYARVNGYLRHWYFDIGTHVPAGAVLAEIDTPEVDQQLAAANAALATANAQRALAATTASRFSALAAQNAASVQTADERRGDLAARASMRDEALADVGRLRALVAFKQLVAPFAGVVTARNTDIGSLISPGQPGAPPLFTVSDLGRLRLYVSVPQNQVAQIAPGLPAHFTVPDFPGRSFAAVVDRTSGAIDPQSGAMLVELAYDNSAGLLKAGDYAQVTIALPPPTGPGPGSSPSAGPNQNPAAASTQPVLLRVPASSLLFRAAGTELAVAGADGKVSMRKVSVVTDFGTELDVDGNLGIGDWVIDNPPDAIGDGDKVRTTPEQANRHA